MKVYDRKDFKSSISNTYSFIFLLYYYKNKIDEMQYHF